VIRYDGDIPRWVVPAILATWCVALLIAGSYGQAVFPGLLAVVTGIAVARGTARW